MAEQDTMAVLASVLADPAAAAQRMKDLNAARTGLEHAKLDDDKRKAELAKMEADANSAYKKASEERLAAARDLKDAEDKRKAAQALLDKTNNREGEVNQREGAVVKKETFNEERAALLNHRERALDEREEKLKAREDETTVKLSELNRKLKALKDIAA